jgi:hypothetical protein
MIIRANGQAATLNNTKVLDSGAYRIRGGLYIYLGRAGVTETCQYQLQGNQMAMRDSKGQVSHWTRISGNGGRGKQPQFAQGGFKAWPKTLPPPPQYPARKTTHSGGAGGQSTVSRTPSSQSNTQPTVCWKCNGTKYISCFPCSGEGYTETSYGGTHDTLRCNICNGSGRATCDNCRGTGYD